MKIALVTNNYRPYSGGVVSALDTLAPSLVDLGHEVLIITLDFEGQGSDYNLPVPVIRLNCPLRFKYKSNPVAVPWLPTQAMLQLLTSFKPDIIHTHHPFLLGISALKAGRKLAYPVVFTYHSQYEKFAHLVPIPQIISTNLIRQRLLDYCQHVNGIIAPSTTIAQALSSNLGIKQLSVIPSAISPLYLEGPFGLKKTGLVFKLLTVSRFAKEKNIKFLLDMFKRLINLNPNFNLTLVGYGPELANLEHYAYHVLGLSPALVVFINQPSKMQIRQLYHLSDLFIFASQAETQGLVLAEAMACGTPVVALHGAGQDDLVVHGQNGYLVNDLVQMISAINHLASKLSLHQSMQKAAFATGQGYQPILLAAKLIDFYQKF